jgi:toxin YoeB
MEVAFLTQGWEDYLYWQSHDKKVLKKINSLLKDIARNSTEGIGSPEALKHNLAGYWSRRITLEHRLVYRVHENQIRVLQCRYHY